MLKNILRLVIVLALAIGCAQNATADLYDEAIENFIGIPLEAISSEISESILGGTVAGVVSGLSENFPISSVTPPLALRSVGDELVPIGPPGMGPLMFAERATTQGKGMLNVSTSFTYIDFEVFQGTDMSDLQFSYVSDLGPVDVHLDSDVKASITAVALAYGVTDNLDIAVIVPWVAVDFDNRLEIDQVGGTTVVETDEDYEDLGDILIRGKLLLAETPAADIALGFDFKTKTGDEDKLLGTGYETYKPFVILSKGVGQFVPHMNVGYSFVEDFGSSSSKFEKLTYAAGVEFVPGSRFTAAADIIGFHKFNAQDDVGEDIVNLSLGFKWAALQWGATEGGVPTGNLIVYGNVMRRVNEDGARADWVPTVGMQVAF